MVQLRLALLIICDVFAKVDRADRTGIKNKERLSRETRIPVPVSLFSETSVIL